MEMWLKLTLSDGSPILMNMDKLSWGMCKGDGSELIFYKNDEEGGEQEIKETVNEVWAMMQKFQTG